MDDGSSNIEILEQNRQISQIAHCTYIRNSHNVGRSKIRNTLVSLAHYPYLVFLDSDMMPIRKDFALLYMQMCGKADVVCGGIKYHVKPGEATNPLRLMFGLDSEQASASERQKTPYCKITPSNLMISSTVFEQVKFDENIVLYGYEDVLFAKELQANNISIAHIDNPAYHLDTDSSKAFLDKTRTSLEVLSSIEDRIGNMSRIVSAYRKIERLHLTPLLSAFYSVTHRLMESNLLSDKPSHAVFNIYKISFYCHIKNALKHNSK